MKLTEAKIIKRKDAVQGVADYFKNFGISGEPINTLVVYDNECVFIDNVIIMSCSEYEVYYTKITELAFIAFNTKDASDDIKSVQMLYDELSGKYNTGTIETDNRNIQLYDKEKCKELFKKAISYVREHDRDGVSNAFPIEKTCQVDIMDYDTFVEKWCGWIERHKKLNGGND